MYKVVSKNVDSIKIGDYFVDFGGNNADNFDLCLNSDESELLSLPKIKERLYYYKVLDVFFDEKTEELKITLSDLDDDYEFEVNIRTFSVLKLNDRNGWGKVAIFPEKDLLFLRLKYSVA